MKETKLLVEAKEMAQLLSPLSKNPLSKEDKKYLKAIFTGMSLERELHAMNANAN